MGWGGGAFKPVDGRDAFDFKNVLFQTNQIETFSKEGILQSSKLPQNKPPNSKFFPLIFDLSWEGPFFILSSHQAPPPNHLKTPSFPRYRRKKCLLNLGCGRAVGMFGRIWDRNCLRANNYVQ